MVLELISSRLALSLTLRVRLVAVRQVLPAAARTLLRPTTTPQPSTTMALACMIFLDVLMQRLATTMLQQPLTMVLACRTTSAESAVAMASQPATVTVMVTSSTPWAYVVATAQLTLTPMASVMMLTTALEQLMLAASATVQAPFTNADVQTSPPATATVMATSSTPWAYVVATAQLTLTLMASVTTLTTA